MEIQKGIEIIDLALYINKDKALVISDLHIGYEEYLNKQGILVPRFQFEEIINRLKKILKIVNPDKIVINGDLKHEFGNISYSESKQIKDLIDFFKDKEIIIIKGNHDPILEPILKQKNVKLVDKYDISDVSIVHGDKILKDLKKTIIIGHEHPAISFKERNDEKYKCFLKGKYKKHNLLVLPSFNMINHGSDISKEKLLSPYLQKDINNFEVFVIEDKVYKFGKVKFIN